MKYLKDIPDLSSHKNFNYLSNHKLWETPLRFINENSLTELYIEAKNDIGEIDAGELVTSIVSCATFAKFLGLADHIQIEDFSIGTI